MTVLGSKQKTVISLIFSEKCSNHQQNKIVFSVILNGALQMEQSVALTFGVLHWVNWIIPRGLMFVQQAQGSSLVSPGLITCKMI